MKSWSNFFKMMALLLLCYAPSFSITAQNFANSTLGIGTQANVGKWNEAKGSWEDKGRMGGWTHNWIAVPVAWDSPDDKKHVVEVLAPASDNNDNNLLDALVLYSTDERSPDLKRGIPMSDTKIREWIDEAIADLNNAFLNSGVDMRVDLAHAEKVQYRGMSGDDTYHLDNLTEGKNGLESTKSLRDRYHADIVLLICNSSNQGNAGQAKALKSLTGDHACARFCVLRPGLNSAFVHEVGHIFGAMHDEVKNGKIDDAIFPYAHGYTGDNYTPNTIVGGYKKGVKGIGKVNFYSNPDLKFRNAPLGDRNTGDNRRTFNETMPTIEKCRDSKVTWTGKANTDWGNSGNWSSNMAPRDIDDVVIPAGLSNYPVINGNANARNLLIGSGAKLNMTGGQLNVRGYFKSEGAFTGNGGSVTLKNNMDKVVPLTLSSDSYFSDLKIGDGNTNTWAQLTACLKVRGSLTIEKGAILDGADNYISVSGDWNDNGGGRFNYNNTSVKIGGKMNRQNTYFKFNIPKDPNGGNSFNSEIPGWMFISENGNAAETFMAGGNEGELWKLWYGDKASELTDPVYMYKFDTWAFTPWTHLVKGATYRFELECKVIPGVGGDGVQTNITINYGKGQLPSLSKQTGTSTMVKSDNNWQPVVAEVNVSESGSYHFGIHVFVNEEMNGKQFQVYIRNTQLTATTQAPQDFGKFSGSEPATCKEIPNNQTPTTTSPAENLVKINQIQSFQSVNFPTKYIRHQGGLGKITDIVSDLDKKDASFKVVPALDGSDGYISLESTNYPGYSCVIKVLL